MPKEAQMPTQNYECAIESDESWGEVIEVEESDFQEPKILTTASRKQNTPVNPNRKPGLVFEKTDKKQNSTQGSNGMKNTLPFGTRQNIAGQTEKYSDMEEIILDEDDEIEWDTEVSHNRKVGQILKLGKSYQNQNQNVKQHVQPGMVDFIDDDWDSGDNICDVSFDNIPKTSTPKPNHRSESSTMDDVSMTSNYFQSSFANKHIPCSVGGESSVSGFVSSKPAFFTKRKVNETQNPQRGILTSSTKQKLITSTTNMGMKTTSAAQDLSSDNGYASHDFGSASHGKLNISPMQR